MTLRVLVVDDNRDNINIMRAQLAKAGYEVDYAYDGETALQLLRQARFDVVLLDVMMPKMDGHEVLRRMRDTPQWATIPVIMVTAKGTNDDVLQGYQGGADYYIPKPFTAGQLLHGIALVLGREQVA